MRKKFGKPFKCRLITKILFYRLQNKEMFIVLRAVILSFTQLN